MAHLMIALNQIIMVTWGTKDKTLVSFLIKMINEFWREKRKPLKREKKRQSLKVKKLSLTLVAFFKNDYIQSIIITMWKEATITIMGKAATITIMEKAAIVIATVKKPQA